jgi:hypothetical protein
VTWQFLLQLPNYKFHEKPSSFTRTDGWKDKAVLIAALWDAAEMLRAHSNRALCQPVFSKPRIFTLTRKQYLFSTHDTCEVFLNPVASSGDSSTFVLTHYLSLLSFHLSFIIRTVFTCASVYNVIQSVPKVPMHWNIWHTRVSVCSSSWSIALQAAGAQHTSGAVKKRVQTCLQARGGHFQHLWEELQRGTWYFTAQ